MNIFVTSMDPMAAASHLDDLRLNKMILESTQVMAMAMDMCGADPTILPKTKAGTTYKVNGPHRRHPVTIWTANNSFNYNWHLKYLMALHGEYHYRHNKTHGCYDCMATMQVFQPRDLNIYLGNRTQFFNCSAYKDQPVLLAYQLTLLDKWKNDKRQPKWTRRAPPSWLTANPQGKLIVDGDKTFFRSKKLEAEIEDLLLSPPP